MYGFISGISILFLQTFLNVLYYIYTYIFFKKISLKDNCKEEGIAVFMLSSQEENLHGVHLLLDTVFCDLVA